jgi:hypothetical protein
MASGAVLEKSMRIVYCDWPNYIQGDEHGETRCALT